MKSKKKILIVLLFIAIISGLGLTILFKQNYIANNYEKLNKIVTNANWPINEVPLLLKENIEITSNGNYIREAKIDSGVTYEELRSYLIKLYSNGFNPIEELGSKDPNILNSTIEGADFNSIIWMGKKGDYQINVMWAEEGGKNEYGSEYKNHFEVTLFIDSEERADNTNYEEEYNVISEEIIEEENSTIEVKNSNSEEEIN